MKKKNKKEQTPVEICASFSYKLNLGNYQTADFFCSQKAETLSSKAVKTYEALHDFCREMVIKSVNKYKTANAVQVVKKEEPPVVWIGEKGKKKPVAKSDVETEEAEEQVFHSEEKEQHEKLLSTEEELLSTEG